MDTVIKDHKFRHPETEYEQVADEIIRLAKPHNIVNHLISKKAIMETLAEAQEVGIIRTWYDSKDSLVGVLMFQIGQQWWSDAICVSEETVLCLNHEYAGIQREAMRELERIANAWGAKLIVSGNIISANQKLIENGYMKRGGYHHKSSSFLKVMRGEDDG